MAPVDFEKQMREKLQERELTPNPKTWSKLEQQLALQEKPTRTLIRPWAVAAALIAMVLLSVWWLRPTAEVATPLVTTPEVQTELPEREETVIEVFDTEIASEENATENIERQSSTPSEAIAVMNKQKENTSEEILAKKSVENLSKENIVLAENTVKDTPLLKENIQQAISFEEQKVNEIVAQVQLLQQQNNSVSNAEIEALLEEAQQDIKQQRLFKEGTFKIDAMTLLQEVEFELERNFREKVFDALGKGFEKIRTAVAERNQ